MKRLTDEPVQTTTPTIEAPKPEMKVERTEPPVTIVKKSNNTTIIIVVVLIIIIIGCMMLYNHFKKSNGATVQPNA